MAKRAKFTQGTPPPGYQDTEVLRLTRDGVWLADGHEITHEPTRALFARSLEKDDQGYFLHIGHEMKRIEVEDTAYFVISVDGTPKKGFHLKINDGTEERLDPTTLSYRPGRLTCVIKGPNADENESAKFLPSAYMQILSGLEEDDRCYFLTIGGTRIELSPKA